MDGWERDVLLMSNQENTVCLIMEVFSSASVRCLLYGIMYSNRIQHKTKITSGILDLVQNDE